MLQEHSNMIPMLNVSHNLLNYSECLLNRIGLLSH
jgi:hypothetical protein